MILMGWMKDRTLNYLFEQLEKIGNPVLRLMLDDFFSNEHNKIDMSSESEIRFIHTFLDIHRGHGIYARLLNPFDISDGRSVSITRMMQYIDGLESSMVCNKASSIPSNFSKVIHSHQYMHLLKAHDILIPNTLLTNELRQGSLNSFLNTSEIVIKGASSKKSICSPVSSAHLEKAKRHQCISLLQERIIGPDIRVHMTPFGYAAEGFVSSEVDYRFAKSKKGFQVELPLHIEAFCKELIEFEDVVFAGIDFKLNSTGKWYFLEANSSPAFQGFDRRANGRIVKLLSMWDAWSRSDPRAMKPYNPTLKRDAKARSHLAPR